MTDMVVTTGAAPAIDIKSAAARARTRKRYRAEARFKAYGIAAILFALAFLVFLVSDIVIKAIPAFTTTDLALRVNVTAEAIDPDRTGRPDVIARGDFMAPVRAALLEQFPSVAGDRRSRQKLLGLISSGGPDILRDEVVANPALIGQSVTVPVLLSDDADLFFKDLVTRSTETVSRGIGSPSATSGAVNIFSSANDFSSALVEIKRALSVQARDIRREVDRFRDLAADMTADRTRAEADLAAARVNDQPRIPALEGAIAKIDSDLASVAAQIETLSAQSADYERRFNDSGSETLDASIPSLLVEINGGVVKVAEMTNDRVTGETLIPLASTADAAPGTWKVATYLTPESKRKLADQEIAWLVKLKESGQVTSRPNWMFFSTGDSREAELAGVLGALVGSALTMLVTLVLCLPVGVAAAIYLEEFAPKNRWTDIIEVNINNLAAVPSIVFGLLGLAVFLNFFGLPRSTPIVGGLVLALLVLPTIIIASRAALKAVPPSIREAALGVGASHQQAVFQHVLPLAMPGILTGTIIGMAHALGETAPLLLIGMVAFIVDVPHGVTQAATVLPVQIFLWSDLPEVGFQAKTSAAILVLLLFLLIMNGLAIVLRKRFERRY
jgi:phosphate transport system permease protein